MTRFSDALEANVISFMAGSHILLYKRLYTSRFRSIHNFAICYRVVIGPTCFFSPGSTNQSNWTKCGLTTYFALLHSYTTGHLLPSSGLNYLTAVLMRKGSPSFLLSLPDPPGFPRSRLGTGAGDPPLDQKKKTSEQRIGFCLGKPDPHPVRKLSGIAGPRLLLRFCSLLLSLSPVPLAHHLVVIIK